jgi:hypothetical protein
MTTNDDRPTDPMARLTRINPTVVVLATLVLFLGVLLLPDVIGGVLILVIVAGLGWLLNRTWPVLAPPARLVRLLVIALLLAVAAVKFFG